MKKVRWDKKDIGFIKDNYGLSSKKYMGKELGRSWSLIQRKANRLNIHRMAYGRSEHNVTFFDNWSNDMVVKLVLQGKWCNGWF